MVLVQDQQHEDTVQSTREALMKDIQHDILSDDELSSNIADRYSDDVSSADEHSTVSWRVYKDFGLTPVDELKERKLKFFEDLRAELVVNKEDEKAKQLEEEYDTSQLKVDTFEGLPLLDTPTGQIDKTAEFIEDVAFTYDDENENLDDDLEGFLSNVEREVEDKKKPKEVVTEVKDATNVLKEHKFNVIARQVSEISTPTALAVSPYGKVILIVMLNHLTRKTDCRSWHKVWPSYCIFIE
jgi:hypothetical protein